MLFTHLLAVSYLTASASAALQHKGVDWSSLFVEEVAGRKYKTTSGTTQPLETLLKNNGVNTVRQRLWVNPKDSKKNYDLNYNINLAKRARAAGLNVYLDLHYSDTWADPAHQSIPSGWPTNINDLSNKIYEYTKSVSNTFASNGVPLSIISIGNEITAGLLWPVGSTKNFYNVARLLHSAAWGIKDSNLNPKPKIMVHTDNGWKWDTQKWFFDTLLAQGPFLASDYDMIGLSYYPFYNQQASLGNLKSSLQQVASRYKKQIVIAETDWPVSCPSPKYPFPSDTSSVPKSAEGQRTWVKKVAEIVGGVSGGVGLFYWEPAWVDNAALGSSCPDNAMFEWAGNARSSLAVFKEI